jgi:hypothetical protein
VTAADSRAAAIARAVLAQAQYAEPKPYTALTYGVQQVLVGQAAAAGLAPEAYYQQQVAEMRAEHDRAVAEAAAADEVADLARKVRDSR